MNELINDYNCKGLRKEWISFASLFFPIFDALDIFGSAYP